MTGFTRPGGRITALLFALIACALSACDGGQRVSSIGRAPDLSPIGSGISPPPVAPAPVTPQSPATPSPQAPTGSSRASLFGSAQGARPGFGASPVLHRYGIGDVLTVIVDIDDGARTSVQTNTGRATDIQINGAGISAGGSSSGGGTTGRSDRISTRLGARIIAVLPDGSYRLLGRHELGVGPQTRRVTVEGIARPRDIAADGSIAYVVLADGRLDIGGSGPLSDVERPRWGQQILDQILPF